MTKAACSHLCQSHRSNTLIWQSKKILMTAITHCNYFTSTNIQCQISKPNGNRIGKTRPGDPQASWLWQIFEIQFWDSCFRGLLLSNLGDLGNVTLNKLHKILTSVLGSYQQVRSSLHRLSFLFVKLKTLRCNTLTLIYCAFKNAGTGCWLVKPSAELHILFEYSFLQQHFAPWNPIETY